METSLLSRGPAGEGSGGSRVTDILRTGEFFHGMLRFRHAKQMVRETGEFLVHAVTRRRGQGFVAAVTVKTEDDFACLALRVTEEGRYTLGDGKRNWVDVPTAIRWHVERNAAGAGGSGAGLPLGVNLRRPIGRRCWEAHPSQLGPVESQLGRGNFGAVEQRRFKGRGGWERAAAVKRPRETDAAAQNELLEEALVTVRAQASPWVLWVYGVVTLELPVCLVLELSEWGDLRGFVADEAAAGRRLAEWSLVKLALDCARAVAHMETLKILHLDIAGRNFLVVRRTGGERRAVLSDFGCAREGLWYLLTPEDKVSIRWAAPELMGNPRLATPKSELWALGVVFWELFSAPPIPTPYAELQNDEGLPLYLGDNHRLTIPTTVPPTLKTMIGRMWNGHAHARPAVAVLIALLKRLLRQSHHNQHIPLPFHSID